MALKYSSSLKSFFDTDIHKEIPLDAVEITEEYHKELLANQALGMEIVSDRDGVPQSALPEPPSLEQVRASMPTLSRRQVFIGLVASGLITETEALASGSAMPAIVESAIGTLPKEAQSPARLTFALFIEAKRADPIVALLGAAAGLSDDALDAFWTKFAAV